MPTVIEIADALAEALPRESPVAHDLVAVGMVATALIGEAEPCDRSKLVETFCAVLRDSVAGELN